MIDLSPKANFIKLYYICVESIRKVLRRLPTKWFEKKWATEQTFGK